MADHRSPHTSLLLLPLVVVSVGREIPNAACFARDVSRGRLQAAHAPVGLRGAPLFPVIIRLSLPEIGYAMPTNKSLPLPPQEIINDYRLAYRSRQASIIGRREVLSGKAKFGIFGDGKEVAQLAIARAFRKGDWRSGYYRDQTWNLALGTLSLPQYFALLYNHAELEAEPATAARAMPGHFASRYIDRDGSWKDQTQMYNIAADVSPTAAQMPRLVGLAYASRLYRFVPELKAESRFSKNGDEVAWGTIGNASTAEGTVLGIGQRHRRAAGTGGHLHFR